MDLNEDQRIQLRTLVNSPGVSADVATRARIVLWHAENRPRKEVAELAGVSRPTVDLWVGRFMSEGIAGLSGRKRGAAREQMSPRIRARILALARTSPPAETGLSHWSSREMADYVRRTENTYVSHHYVAKLWRENGLKLHPETVKGMLDGSMRRRQRMMWSMWVATMAVLALLVLVVR